MFLCIMETKNISFYIAEIAVLSEIFSIIQSIINVAGGNLSYLNSIVFFVLCLPILSKLKMPRELYVVIGVFFLFILAKILFQGLGLYYQKALLLVVLIPFYVVLFRQVMFSDIAAACKKYRYGILFLGMSYVCMWYFLGNYRNASTVTIFLMLFLGFSSVWSILMSFSLALVMKTQYKIWLLVSLFGFLFKNTKVRMFLFFLAGSSAAIFPLALVSIDLSKTGFSLSELASLEERLREVRAFINLMWRDYALIGFGWPIGQSISVEGLSERGYMHSAYLWLFGTLGLPVMAVVFGYVFCRTSSTRKIFFVRLFLILSNSLTFLIFTNPFSTALMFSDDTKKTN